MSTNTTEAPVTQASADEATSSALNAEAPRRMSFPLAARADRRARVVEAIETELQCKAEAITDEARLIEDLGADSMDLAEILMSLEVEFDISIDSEAWKDWTTVGDVVAAVESRVGGAK